MRLYIIRHADPDYENNTITSQGRKEAKALAKRMKSTGIDHIYCSPLGRAIDTMKYSARLMHLEYTIQDWTKEIPITTELEPWGKMSIVDVPGEVIRGEKPYNRSLELQSWFNNLEKESDSFLLKHGYERRDGMYRIIQSNTKKIAVFCHAGMGMAWIAHLLAIPLSNFWSGFWPAPSSVTTILFEERSETWAVPRCIGFGDVSHLYKSRLPISSRGLIANQY
jgi:broad specificity phosphatase PhoE